MKIVHCCFGNEHYIDTWGYQQNLLPLYHAKLGHETVVLASNDTYPSFVDKTTVDSIKSKGNSYYNGPVRVERSNSWFHSSIHFQKAKGLFKQLEKESPDIIFFHGCLNFSLLSCVKYKRHNKSVSLFVDNHGDKMNVNPSVFYRFFYFKLFWSVIHSYCQCYVDRYFGVTSGRCSFLEQFFHIKPSNVSLLPIGADIDAASSITKDRAALRKEYGFNDKDIILVHGGKLDARKGTVDLINAYRYLRNNVNNHLRLVLFGKMRDERIAPLLSQDIVVYEWLSRQKTFELFKMADLAIWPIHHTTLIEDCIAARLPYLIRKTDTTQHLINSEFYLVTGDASELIEKITRYINMAAKGYYVKYSEEMLSTINYYTIAESVVELHQENHRF